MKAFLATAKERTQRYLDCFLAEKQQELSLLGISYVDTITEIGLFCSRGKMIRAAMNLLGWQAGNGGDDEALLPVAGAMELLHAGLLIHDDVMDHDDFRRGQPSFHRRYADRLAEEGSANPRHTGEALALCAGDVAFFLAGEALSRATLPESRHAEVRRTFFRECLLVGIGQMSDVYLGARRSPASLAEILHVYRYKTARYTFSMPFILGARAAGADETVVRGLDTVGEQIGTLFQIKDDELGLFGEAAEIGKPTGSDIREGKKTILFSFMVEQVTGPDHDRLLATLGNPAITDDDIAFVRDLARRSGALDAVRARAAAVEAAARTAIAELPVTPEVRHLLNALVDYNRDRGF